MRKDCATYLEALANLAEGKPEPEAFAHTEACPRCAQRLAQLRKVLQLAAIPAFDAPADLISRAKGLMAPRRRSVLAGVLRSNFALSGARSLPETAQLLVGEDSSPIRLMVRRDGAGYELLGELPGEDWTVTAAIPVEQDGSRFRMLFPDEDTSFLAENESLSVNVPALEELLGGTESAR